MKIIFYYVRHGETLFNQLGRMQGTCDSPLTRKGIQEAEDIASALRNVPFSCAYTSSAERAIDTAQEIMKYHGDRPIHETKDLKEFDFGDLDGALFEEYRNVINAHKHTEDWTDVHGEPQVDFEIRMHRAFNDMVMYAKDGDHILVVSHGSYFMHMLRPLFQMDVNAYQEKRKMQGKKNIGNCEAAVFCYEDGNWTWLSDPKSAEELRKEKKKHVHFYYVRHGETLFNTEKRVQGWCDSPLTKTGILQAEMACDVLKNIPFSAAYTSTSERARDTSEIILQPHHLTAKRDPRIKEIFFGRYEGKHYEPVQKEITEHHITEDWQDLGGQSREDLISRIQSFFNNVIDQTDDEDHILIVSHGTLYLNILSLFFGLNRKVLEERCKKEGIELRPNGGIFRFDWDEDHFALVQMMVSPEQFKVSKE